MTSFRDTFPAAYCAGALAAIQGTHAKAANPHDVNEDPGRWASWDEGWWDGHHEMVAIEDRYIKSAEDADLRPGLIESLKRARAKDAEREGDRDKADDIMKGGRW